ncbi:MAG: hypothetical protein U0905_17785 [Pirellulales bacterium]
MSQSKVNYRRSLRVLRLVTVGVLSIYLLTVYVCVPLLFAWPDIKHQLDARWQEEFEQSGLRTAGRCKTSSLPRYWRMAWRWRRLHFHFAEAVMKSWLTHPFHESDWQEGPLDPSFQRQYRIQDADRNLTVRRYWSKSRDRGNQRIIMVQPQTGDVWYTEVNS